MYMDHNIKMFRTKKGIEQLSLQWLLWILTRGKYTKERINVHGHHSTLKKMVLKSETLMKINPLIIFPLYVEIKDLRIFPSVSRTLFK